MNFITRLAALVAAITLTLGFAPAYADDEPAPASPVVTTSDVDITADTCFPDLIRISGMYTGDPDDFYQLALWGPGDRFIPGLPPLWYASTPEDMVTGLCSDDLPEGTYTITVDRVVSGAFTVYRPVLEVVTDPPAAVERSTGAHRGARKASAVLTIRGAALAGKLVTAHNRYAGAVHTTELVTNSAGTVKTKCPRSRTCRVSFTYDALNLSSDTVKVRRR